MCVARLGYNTVPGQTLYRRPDFWILASMLSWPAAPRLPIGAWGADMRAAIV